uniref:Uncharacterized protein n=1 Tax=Romanomermis culicivorax TaxID=13658 RepID=A0A915JHC8_ROMCU
MAISGVEIRSIIKGIVSTAKALARTNGRISDGGVWANCTSEQRLESTFWGSRHQSHIYTLRHGHGYGTTTPLPTRLCREKLTMIGGAGLQAGVCMCGISHCAIRYFPLERD